VRCVTKRRFALLPRSNAGRYQVPLVRPTSRYCSIGADADEYVVFDGDRCIGWIFKPSFASPSKPWFWTITDRCQPPSIHNEGYAATREQAMADFKKQWLS
jgi:hypothetical protein